MPFIKGHPFYGKKREWKEKICYTCGKNFLVDAMRKKRVACSMDCRKGAFKKGVKSWNSGKNAYWIIGEKNPRWCNGNYVKRQKRYDSAYVNWHKKVKIRDRNICKINNKNCKGQIQVHHILPWRDYPELRYEINNGITLCHFHHPRKRVEERRLIPFFQSMVEVK